MISRNKAARQGLLTTAGVATIALAAGLDTPVAAQDEAVDGSANDRIVVTGSRIQRRDFEANSPIVTVESEAFEAQW